MRVYKEFSECFNYLPLAALIDDKILCMHGGLSPELRKVEEIYKIKRPFEVPESGVSCDLVWSDPEKNKLGWNKNERGISYVFGEDILRKFLI